MIALALAIAFGIGLGPAIRSFRPVTIWNWLAVAGAALLCGLGLTSCTFFAARVVAPQYSALPLILDVGLLAASMGVGLRSVRLQRPARPAVREWIAGAVLIGAAVLTVWSFFALARAAPHGDWDAWATWNLRAKYLLAEPHLAYSSELRSSHPQYPMLVTASVARLWWYAKGTSTGAPAAVAGSLFFATILLAVGVFASGRGVMLGLLAPMPLLAAPALLLHLSSGYADVPVALLMTAAVLLLAGGTPVLAGLCAGLAAWTKDEGIAFAALFLLLSVLFERRQWFRIVAGAAMPLAVTAWFKLQLASRAADAPAAVPFAWNPDRVEPVISALRGSFLSLGGDWYHPILPVFSLLILLGVDRARVRRAAFTGLLAAAMFVAYFAAYMTSPYDLRWQLSTSVGRLALQVWPLIGFAFLLAVRSPESLTVPVAAPMPNRRRK